MGRRVLALIGAALFGSVVVVAFQPRPPSLEAPAAPAAAPSALPTLDPNVPAACAADVQGETFSRGTLDERLTVLRAWSAGGTGLTASLVLTDDVLTQSVRASLAGPYAPPFEDPAVAIHADGLRVTGQARGPFFLRFPISATLLPEVSGGVLRFGVRDLSTGGLPSAYDQQVRELIEEAADPVNWRLPLSVDGFLMRLGCAVVLGRN